MQKALGGRVLIVALIAASCAGMPRATPVFPSDPVTTPPVSPLGTRAGAEAALRLAFGTTFSSQPLADGTPRTVGVTEDQKMAVELIGDEQLEQITVTNVPGSGYLVRLAEGFLEPLAPGVAGLIRDSVGKGQAASVRHRLGDATVEVESAGGSALVEVSLYIAECRDTEGMAVTSPTQPHHDADTDAHSQSDRRPTSADTRSGAPRAWFAQSRSTSAQEAVLSP